MYANIYSWVKHQLVVRHLGQKACASRDAIVVGETVRTYPSADVVSLTPEDVRALIKGIESQSGFWRVRATYAPGPLSKRNNARWAYAFWVGPPSADIVPPIAITRHVAGYQITILDPLELFSAGAFEMVECVGLADTVNTVCEFIIEVRDLALDYAVPSGAAYGAQLVQECRSLAGDRTRETTGLHEFILDSMPPDSQPH